MKKFILARKLNMTQVFTADGRVIPVTVLLAPACKVTALLTPEKNRYRAVQIESGDERREFRVSDGDYQIGQEIKVTDFEPGEVVSIVGESKGRGTAGAVKRHGFHGAPASHGHDHPRAVGSIGQRFPQHVRPGLRMAGHMGAARATVKNSVVIAIEPQKNWILVKGGVPGAPQGLLQIVTQGKKKEMPAMAEYKS
ncbi:MAG: 50S ribosomal protein L3 [Candidatus Doudnabacteria bacterium RIFCSPHIGHO2_01_52_17]|uniref:Large ribosomal subunit protein uL3 n=1 Tax=Candidatus Doudnabacteria bacterium RIFCSPHIGHO2_01_52_17 TaxID=1817820 RepID=A0A1F5NFE7_9BACT|nr:ribosomal protein L3 [uncultured bacterium]KKW29791.1 MAG: 50S ribosomal protein L3 [Parcubacteria group bacterium GW2011_GWA2_52_8]OGE76411.1 MAG: 50S ribosomal protein L3 [Candidatus Doudnabacteria bacterium RIFCSPHIGHO2_01_52_17]